jgi:hypothetical protein
MAELHETLVDGVRCFWVETGRPTLASLLLFRYGLADESIVESGWQHLLEHLALHGRGGGAISVNGQVSVLETAFQVHGPPAEVAGLLGDLTSWLAAPELGALDHEAKVLRAEASMRGVPAAASALSMRYGAQGPGLIGYREPGLGRATASGLTARAARVFTRENAVLVLDGPPPVDLRLSLPPGELLPCREAVPCDDNLPAAYLSEAGLTVSGIVSRSSGMFVAHDLLREAMSEQFRMKDAAAYAPWVTYERVDNDQAVIVAGSDIHPDALSSAAKKTLVLVDRLRRDLADPGAFSRLQDARIQALRDPYARVGVAARAAHEVLYGRPPVQMEQMVEEIASLDLVRIREQWEAFHATMLLGVPPGSAWEGQLPVLEFPRTSPSRRGKRHRSVNWPADRSRLVIDDTAVEISVKDEARRVPLEQVAALFTYDDGLRHVVRRDGYSLMIDPRVWRGGSSAVARLDAAVPEDLHLPHPMPQGGTVPQRLSVGRRWITPAFDLVRRPFRFLDVYMLGAIGLLLGGLLVGLGMLATGQGGWPLVLVPAIWGFRILVAASRRHLRSRGGR